MARVVVDVMLKPEILDPQGRAVRGALVRQGLAQVVDVRQGKQFVIEVAGPLDDATRARLHDLAENLLSNPVIENYEIVWPTPTESPAGCGTRDSSRTALA